MALSPAFVQTLAAQLALNALFGPLCALLQRRSAGLSTGSVRRSPASPTPRSKGHSWCCAASCIAADSARRTAYASPPAAGCACSCCASATTARSGDIRGAPGRGRSGRWYDGLLSGSARMSTSPSTCARAKRASTLRLNTAARADSSTRPRHSLGDWGGLDRRAADDGSGLRHGPESRRPPVRKRYMPSPHARRRRRLTLSCCGDHSRHVPPLRAAPVPAYPTCW